MLKHRSFARSTMPRRFPRTCPVCGRPHLKNLSTHLFKVHGLSPEERKPHLKQAQVSSWQVACPPPFANAEKPREKRVSQWEHSPPAKRPRTATHTTSLATKSCPEFNFRHKLSLLVVGPTWENVFCPTNFGKQSYRVRRAKEYSHFLVLQSMARML